MSHSTSKSDPRSDALQLGASCEPAELGPNMPKDVPKLSKKASRLLSSGPFGALACLYVCVCSAPAFAFVVPTPPSRRQWLKKSWRPPCPWPCGIGQIIRWGPPTHQPLGNPAGRRWPGLCSTTISNLTLLTGRALALAVSNISNIRGKPLWVVKCL